MSDSMRQERLAMLFALENHHPNQKYGDLPYVYHLYNVVQNVTQYYDRDTKMIQAAWMHDVLEDTAVSYFQVDQKFGKDVAELVYAVTDDLGKNRRERKDKTWGRLAEFENYQGLGLKLCDLLANVADSAATGNKLDMYKKDYPLFRDKFYDNNHSEHSQVWDELDRLIKFNEPTASNP